MRRTAALLVALVGAGGGAAWAQAIDAGAGRVVSLTGSLTARGLRQDARPLGRNDLVQPGEELITGENSQAVIRAADGSTITIYPDSRVVYQERSADIRELLHLFLGSIKVHIEKLSGRPNPQTLTTPTAVIAVRGTTFSVFVDDTEATLVAVEEGVVGVASVQNPAEQVILQGGQRTWVRPGQPPLPAQAFRGRSEAADLIPARAGPGPLRNRDRAMGAEMRERMETMGTSRGMGAMSGRTNPPR